MPWDTLITSVVLYIVIPVCIAQVVAPALLRARRRPRSTPRWPGSARGRSRRCWLTLVLLFAFQGEAILDSRW